MKKKLLAILAATLTAVPIFSEIYSPHRFVEFGLDGEVSAGQNMFGLGDIFVKDLVIDLPKIYDSVGKGGIVTNIGEQVGLFGNVNINGYGAGFRIAENFSGNMNISKDFLKFLAKGNDLDSEMTTSLSANLQFFMDVSVPIYLRIQKFKITAVPSFFVPILYLPKPQAQLTCITDSSGKLSAKAHADFALYSIMDLSKGILTDSEGKTSFDASSLGSTDELLKQLMESVSGCGGMDLGVQIEFPWNEKLDFGAYTNVPIFHGLLKNSLSGSADFAIDMDGFLDTFTGENPGGDAYSMDYSISELQTNTSKYYINRPFRFGIEASYRPFGNWFIIHPKVGVGILNPFGTDFEVSNIYPEYSLDVGLSLFKILGLSLGTEYTNKVFTHALNLDVNLRAVELNLSVGSSGGDFLSSFNLSGLKASLGLSFGF